MNFMSRIEKKLREVCGSDLPALNTQLNIKVIHPIQQAKIDLDKIIHDLNKEHWGENMEVYKFKNNLKEQYEKLTLLTKGWKVSETKTSLPKKTEEDKPWKLI